ncbi:MAG TPA: OB-fold nucleic acid binding domain-containing protein, partial [Gemmataceae bacterium]|nr:OB-fold nucleic acid binding domain-containing protein [Gemmataceae bacterium]
MSTISPTADLQKTLRDSAQYLKGVGPARMEKLRKLGIETVGDLLFHFPRSYEDCTDVRTIAGLTAGKLQTVQGEVVEIQGKELADGRTVVSVVLSDGKNILEGAWFNQVYAAGGLRFGERVAFTGKPKRFRGHWQMHNPRILKIEDGDANEGIVPVYPLTEELRRDQLRPIIRQGVDQYVHLVPEILPPDLLSKRRFPELPRALLDLHFPEALPAALAARRRFIYEEFLILQLALAVRRRELRDRLRAPILMVTPQIDARIRRLFPFQLTRDQNQAVADISRDLAGERPMQRLLQADVGAGKTAVA